jgi:non-homologous end joining protein Ku
VLRFAELVSRRQRATRVNPSIPQRSRASHDVYADEVRYFQQVPKGEKVNVSEKELELGIGLIDRLTSEKFNPENYKDEYRIRVLATLEEKSKGTGAKSPGASAVPTINFQTHPTKSSVFCDVPFVTNTVAGTS